jgi:hypothetical protein
VGEKYKDQHYYSHTLLLKLLLKKEEKEKDKKIKKYRTSNRFLAVKYSSSPRTASVLNHFSWVIKDISWVLYGN